MKSWSLYALRSQFKREQHLRAEQRFRARYHPTEVSPSDGRTLYGSKLEAEKCLFMHLIRSTSDPFTMMWQKGSRLLLRLRGHH